MSDEVRKLRCNASVRRVGGGLPPGADEERGVVRRGRAVVRAVALESEPVSVLRSAKVRRFAVLIVAVITVIMAIRFVFSPIPHP